MKLAVYFLRAEGAAIFILSILTFRVVDDGWLLFILLLLVPDVSMVGYLVNNRVGALTYNVGHTLVIPLIMITAGSYYGVLWMLVGGLIWLAHIGMDRMLGYGLKETKGFKHTHLGKIGK